MVKKLLSNKKLKLILVSFLVISNIGISFAYWASSLTGDTALTNVDVTVGDFDYCEPIFTAQDFYDFATSSTSLSTDSYCLRNDIDFSSFTWNYLSSHATNQFKGTFDGRDFTLSNISMESSASGLIYLSLFSRMDGATIKNVRVENYGMGFSQSYYNSSSIQAGIFAGQVTGLNNVIENITIVDADVIANTINGAGGLVGQVQANADLTIRNIKATNLTVLSSSKRAGGLVSRVNPGSGIIIVEDIDLQGYIASNNSTSNNGGIFGTFRSATATLSRIMVDYIAEGSVELSDATITYKAGKFVGGFVGNNNNGSVMSIYDAFYTGELYNSKSNVGTVLGRKKANITLSEVYYSDVLFVNNNIPSSGNTIINSTVVNASSMPSNTWWNGFFINFSAANSLWTQDATGKPVLIR